MFRALAFDFREDVQAHNVDDQFMFGPAFLVCPVTTAMYYGPESRKLHGVSKYRSVYLPVGVWYDYWTDERTEGGRTIESKANLETMPLYVRAGSIVPLGTEIQYADEHPDGDIRLKVYPGKDAIFTLYEDEGDSYGYEEGAYATIEIQWCEAARALLIGKRKGTYYGMPAERKIHVEIAGESGQCTISYHGELITIKQDDVG